MEWIFCPLNSSCLKQEFDCDQPSLNTYLKQYASQNDRKGIAKTIVAVPVDGPKLVKGYYSVSMAQIEFETMPEASRKGLPRYPIPAMRIGRLAVDRTAQGQGLGTELLVDALFRAQSLSREVGIYAVIVDALNESAKEFYKKFGFTPFEDVPLSLFLTLKEISQLWEN